MAFLPPPPLPPPRGMWTPAMPAATTDAVVTVAAGGRWTTTTIPGQRRRTVPLVGGGGAPPTLPRAQWRRRCPGMPVAAARGEGPPEGDDDAPHAPPPPRVNLPYGANRPGERRRRPSASSADAYFVPAFAIVAIVGYGLIIGWDFLKTAGW